MKLKNVSASQVQNFRRCARKWHWEKIGGFKFKGSYATRRGTAIHYGIELYLKTGEIAKYVAVSRASGNVEYTTQGPVADHLLDSKREDREIDVFQTDRFVKAAKQYLPQPGSDVGIEFMFKLATVKGGPVWIGYIDLLTEEEIKDYKTSSDIRRYSKTPEELEEDVQQNAYAKFVFDNSDRDEVPVSLIYLETRNKVKVNSREVTAVIKRRDCEKRWQGMLKDVEQMVVFAEVEDSLQVPCNPEACGDYGGCPHRERCGLSVLHGLGETTKKSEGKKMGAFLKNLKSGDTKETPKEETEGKAETKTEAKNEESIVPPDAPPRTTSDEDAEKLAAKKKKPAAKKKTPAKKTPKKEGLTLLIDCFPAKGNKDFVLFDDWVADRVETLNKAAEDAGGDTFWQAGFAEQKAAIAKVTAEAAKELKGTVVVRSSSSQAVRDFLPLVIPLADDIVQGFKG